MKTHDIEVLHALSTAFQGKTVLVFAPGPDLPDLWRERETSLPKIAVNDAWKIVPDADVLYACDQRWWCYHQDAVASFCGIRIGYEVTVPGVVSLRGTGVSGYDPTLGSVRHGHNSGHQAIHLAAQLGARRIVLVGFSMCGGHFFGQHPRQIQVIFDPALYMARIKELSEILAERGVEVVNATPKSAITFLPTVDLDQIVPRRVPAEVA